MAQVDVAVGVGRPVVQDVGRLSQPRRANLVIEPGFVPLGQEPGLQLPQVGLHGKVGLGKVDRFLQIYVADLADSIGVFFSS